MENNLYDDGLETFPLLWVIGQNLFLIIYFAVGFIGLYPLQLNNIPILSILFILYFLIVLIFTLRKHLCTHCYYYGKWCHCGWGKLSLDS